MGRWSADRGPAFAVTSHYEIIIRRMAVGLDDVDSGCSPPCRSTRTGRTSSWPGSSGSPRRDPAPGPPAEGVRRHPRRHRPARPGRRRVPAARVRGGEPGRPRPALQPRVRGPGPRHAQIIAADNVAGEMDYLLTSSPGTSPSSQQVLARLATRGGQRARDLPPPGGDQATRSPPAGPGPAGDAPPPPGPIASPTPGSGGRRRRWRTAARRATPAPGGGCRGGPGCRRRRRRA